MYLLCLYIDLIEHTLNPSAEPFIIGAFAFLIFWLSYLALSYIFELLIDLKIDLKKYAFDNTATLIY